MENMRPLTNEELAPQSRSATSAHYVGSKACEKCHADIYEHWQKTPMANVVRDPRQHPDAITPDLSTNNVVTFRRKIDDSEQLRACCR